MNPREQWLQAIEQALAAQVISSQDLETVLRQVPGYVEPAAPQLPPASAVPSEAKPKKGLGIIDVLFYLSGIILFAALMTLAFQVEQNSLIMKLVISLGAGLLFWTAAYLLAQQREQAETRQGLTNSLLLTGSLSVVTGAFILSFNLVSGPSSSSRSAVLIYAATLVVLGFVHFVFDRLLRNDILIVFGLSLFVLAFPTAVEGLLVNTTPSPDVWGIIGIITGALFAYGGKLISHTAPGRESFAGAFESFAGFIVMGNIYAMGFASSIAVFWEMLLPIGIYAAFFISIKRRSKQFLVTGSLFLVLFLITMSFKYFSGLGAAFSLILSALSILATAFVASNINKKYIKV